MKLTLALTAVLTLVVVAACGGEGGEGDEGAINVTLQEFSVLPEKDKVPAGSVVFEATNEGPEERHKLVFVKTGIAPADLPTNDDGSFKEEVHRADVIAWIEELAVGEVQSLTLNMTAGNYVLLCNVVAEREGETEAHFAKGMYTRFTVE